MAGYGAVLKGLIVAHGEEVWRVVSIRGLGSFVADSRDSGDDKHTNNIVSCLF